MFFALPSLTRPNYAYALCPTSERESMENSFKSQIEQSKSILILLPTKPYFDQVAAGLSLYLALREEKDVSIYCPSPMTVEFNRLIGVNKISQEMGNKNLIMRFTDYKASDIERVSYDIEDGQFRLTVIPKQKVTPPAKEQIELSYSGISVDTLILIGGANETHFPALSGKDLSSANIVHIGVRDISFSPNKPYVSFSRPASSVSEVIASLIKESGFKLEGDTATNLVMGIEEGSESLASPSVTHETFATLSELMKAGGKRMANQPSAQRTNLPMGSIPGSLTRQSVTQYPAYTNPVTSGQTSQSNQEKEEAKVQEEPPKDWLRPKIYKGTSIN